MRRGALKAMRRRVQRVHFEQRMTSQPERGLARHAVALVIELLVERHAPVVEAPEKEKQQQHDGRQRRQAHHARDQGATRPVARTRRQNRDAQNREQRSAATSSSATGNGC